MKTCIACGEEFADKFSFCPVDGTAFRAVHEFNLRNEQSIRAESGPAASAFGDSSPDFNHSRSHAATGFAGCGH
jgi:hypothetical protein